MSRVSWNGMHVTAELSNVIPGWTLGQQNQMAATYRTHRNMHMQMNISLSAPIIAHPASGLSRKAGTLGQVGESRNQLSWQAGCQGKKINKAERQLNARDRRDGRRGWKSRNALVECLCRTSGSSQVAKKEAVRGRASRVSKDGIAEVSTVCSQQLQT